MIGADVYLWGIRIGAVVQENLQALPRFNYDDGFVGSGIELSPVMMPLSARVYSFPYLNQESFYGLPGLLADSLPDKFGTALLAEYLARRGRRLEEISAVERLLYTGKRGMGALEFRPATELIRGGTESLDIRALADLASDILSKRENMRMSESDHVMEELIDVGTSAGGARAKAVIAWNRETKEIRSGQIDAGEGFEYYLIKFDGVRNNKDHEQEADRPEYTRIEYAYYLLAGEAGIRMNPCELFEENGCYHFLTKRFDRRGSEKLHMQTLAAIGHFDYKQPGQIGYEQAAITMRQLGLGQNEVDELFRRMVFNELYVNYDDHVKNISFLMNKKGEWKLAPAYDLTYSYKPDSLWVSSHQMRINGKQDHITEEDIFSAARSMNLTKAKAKGIIDEVRQAGNKWKPIAERANLTERTADAVAEKWHR